MRRSGLCAVWGLFTLLCLLFPCLSWAQTETGPLQVRFEETDPADFPVVRSRVTVLDARGIPVSGLGAANFAVFEDGQSVPVDTVDPMVNQTVKIAVCLVIDLSGSMYDDFAEAKAQAVSFVTGLGPGDLVAILGFRGNRGAVNLGEPFPVIDDSLEIGFTTDKGAALALIDRLAPAAPNTGTTPLYDALAKAARMTALVSGVDYRFVMAFTDGNEKCRGCAGSVLAPDDPIVEAEKRNIPIFAIGLGENADETYLQRVAFRTGGSYTFTPTADKLAEIYQGVSDQLRSQYQVAYQAKAQADAEAHQLGVKVTTATGEGSNVTTVTYPCPQKPGLRLFYLKLSDVPGGEDVKEVLRDGQVVKGVFSIHPNISACNPIVQVLLLLDGEVAVTATNEPFILSYDFALLELAEPGAHTLTVRAQDSMGQVSDDVVVQVDVGGVTAGPGGSGTTASSATALPTLPPVTGAPTVALGATTPSSTAALPVPTPGGRLIRGIDNWILALIGLLLVVALLAAILLFSRRKQPGPVQAQTASWPAPYTPTVPVEDQTAPEQPAIGFSVGDRTAPDVPAYTETAAVPRADSAAAFSPIPVQRPADRTEMLRRKPQRLAWLIVERGEREGKEYRLQEGDTAIGRAGTANDVVLSDPAVGRQQAKIRLEPDGFYLYDLASTNPTLVNGQQVTRIHLSPGDRVQVGDTTLVFKETEIRQ